MKKLMIVCTCLVSLTAGAALAGHGGKLSEEERAERMARMKAHLELSDEQVAERKQSRADGGGRDDIRAVLSEEQAEKWDEARQRHRQKGGKKHDKSQQTED